jgi:hypothetical protein
VDGTIILKCILNKLDMKRPNGFMWFRARTRGRSCSAEMAVYFTGKGQNIFTT